MKSCDTNILLYYLDSNCNEHSKAKIYFDSIVNDRNFIISDLVLAELFILLTNKKILRSPMSLKEAKDCILSLRSNPSWKILEYSEGTMHDIWYNYFDLIKRPSQIYDFRLGICLLRSGITEFATRNIKDFKGLGFDRVFNPIDGKGLVD